VTTASQARSPGVETELRNVSKNTLMYSIGNVAVKVVSFLLIPLYTHYLDVFDVGIIVLLELLEIFYNSVATLGLVNGIWRYFYNARQEGREGRFVVSNYIFMLGANLLLLVILLLTSGFIAAYFLSQPDYAHLMRLFSVALFFGISRVYLYTLVRIYEKVLPFVLIAFVDSLLLIGLTIWFVIGFEAGINGVILAKVISSGLVFLFTVTYGAKKFGFHYSHHDVRQSLNYGFPLVFHGIGLLILMMSDRYFIKELISVEAGGIYGIAYKFGMIMNMALVTPFGNAWHPLLFRLEGDPNQKAIYQKIALHYVQVATLVWLGISIGSKYGVQIATTAQYYSGIMIIPWIAFSYLLYGLQNVLKAGALLNNKTVAMTRYTVISAILNIVLNFLLIPTWGMMGAAVSTVLSYLTMLLLIYRLSQQHFYISWLWKKMLSIIFLGGLVYCLTVLNIPELKYQLLLDLIVIITFPALLIVLRLVSIQEIRHFIRRITAK